MAPRQLILVKSMVNAGAGPFDDAPSASTERASAAFRENLESPFASVGAGFLSSSWIMSCFYVDTAVMPSRGPAKSRGPHHWPLVMRPASAARSEETRRISSVNPARALRSLASPACPEAQPRPRIMRSSAWLRGDFCFERFEPFRRCRLCKELLVAIPATCDCQSAVVDCARIFRIKSNRHSPLPRPPSRRSGNVHGIPRQRRHWHTKTPHASYPRDHHCPVARPSYLRSRPEPG